MSVVLALVLASAPIHPEWRVAYTAAFYYPPGDRRMSHSEVYVCDLRGGHRKRLTALGHEATDVLWLGRDAITWVDRAKADSTLMKLDLRTGRQTALARGDQLSRSDLDDPGAALPHRGRPVYDVSAARKLVTRTGLGDVPLSNRDGGYGPGCGVLDYTQEKGCVPATLSDGTVLSIYPTVFERAGKRYELVLFGALRHIIPGPDPSIAWLYSNTLAASGGSSGYVQRIDWRTGKLTTVIDDRFGIDFDGSRYWAALDAGRPLSPYGRGKQVWTSAAWVGDLQTGKRWKVADGLVYASSISLRPY